GPLTVQTLGVTLVNSIPSPAMVVAFSANIGLPRYLSAGLAKLMVWLLNSSTRWLSLSATHSAPLSSSARPAGVRKPVALVLGTLLVKLLWPSTPSALAPLALLPTASKRKTRWLLYSDIQAVLNAS